MVDLDQPPTVEQGGDRGLQGRGIGTFAELVRHRREKIAAVEVGMMGL